MVVLEMLLLLLVHPLPMLVVVGEEHIRVVLRVLVVLAEEEMLVLLVEVTLEVMERQILVAEAERLLSKQLMLLEVLGVQA